MYRPCFFKFNGVISFLTFVIFLSSGCASTGFHASVNNTSVQLNTGNYNIVAKNVRGQASARYLLGFSYNLGLYSQTLAAIPLDSDRALYVQAMEDLWRQFEETHGAVEGRRLALANIRYDTQAVNLFFYTRPEVYIVADVIEFD
ncbi:hypothetical protein RCC89_02415 [Cytophagaceae bacterium ABcell3]|nr:hypothetical protein RCC89_02415 [Cytophagaceae bacterium ABcell3]